ncbi:hypothetical protein B0H65DRAFT_548107 [Neurospora tetraspora]|uniref:VanZ-like domain-containing protein n=1 Tax=Neurospora tetraspora TaxID=94610 RepID=A0AAE0MTM1_9PEZI|nr:hypothetical protein B0H65DRAFT_548107 [Neurospora tetraspora]
MRIRMPFAGIFAALLLLSAYAGLSSLHMPQGALLNDKTLHFFVFFLLTTTFYWILDTTRRRILHLTLSVCTLGMGVGSEFVQAAIPDNGREFDPYDILANLVGSLMGLGLCGWYHKRMLERRRVRKYTALPTGEELVDGEGDLDLELGEGVGVVRRSGEHEEGVVVAASAASGPTAASPAAAAAPATTAKNMSLEEELDNWDENAVDAWDEDDEAGDVGGSGAGGKSGDATKDVGAAKKRVD